MIGKTKLALVSAGVVLVLSASPGIAQVHTYPFPGPTYPTPPIHNAPGAVVPITGFMGNAGNVSGPGQFVMNRQLGFAGVIRPSGGLLIRRISPLSPLANMGIRQEDVITSIGGKPIQSGEDFYQGFIEQTTINKDQIEWSVRKFSEGDEQFSTETPEQIEEQEKLDKEAMVPFDVSGTWSTSSRIGNAVIRGGGTTLKQEGKIVTGSFPLGRGGTATLNGKIEGATIYFDWEKDEQNFGTGRLSVSNGSLVGVYTNNFRVQSTTVTLSR